ncbi:phosphatidylinositol N-acetylglucosaminyltransferase subunit C-like [Dysidea avara]|uniref:phosphatidylinositol N-acetylglucosaminyltransferase subunit C-like n=1 Tax=Dysidea avara TaxID=196820 RepID=UPI00332647A9
MSGWKKVLYYDQGYPDNYIEPELFLADLKKNLHTKPYRYFFVVQESGALVQQLSCVCCFICVFVWLQQEWLSPVVLMCCSFLLTLSSFLLVEVSTSNGLFSLSKTGNIQQFAMVIFFLCLLSPIMRTLTESISTDTIWAMSFGMMLVHLAFHNYGVPQAGAKVSDSVSLNAAVFAAVCLASRLTTSLDTFSLLSCAIEMFVFFPHFRRTIKEASPKFAVCMTALWVAASISLLITISSIALTFYLLTTMMITFVCPLWVIKLQHLKNNIYGPWDEAVLNKEENESVGNSDQSI